jgi:transcriptional regulator with XRE-family HTH domain
MPAPSDIIRRARELSGLSQRELARLAGTTQSVVARIELGQTSPTWDTIERLLRAAGLELDTRLTLLPVAHSHMLEDIPRILALTPEERLRELGHLSRFLALAHRVPA